MQTKKLIFLLCKVVDVFLEAVNKLHAFCLFWNTKWGSFSECLNDSVVQYFLLNKTKGEMN